MDTDPVDKPSEPVAPADAAEIKNPPTEGPPLVVSHIPPSPPDPPLSPNASQDNTPPWKKKLEIAAVIVAAGLLIINIFQLLATMDAADAALQAVRVARDARDDNDISGGDTVIQMKAQGRAMRRSAEATQQTVTQSQRALDASIEASRNDQRAWLAIVDMHIVKEPVVGEKFRVTYAVANTGKTPATDSTTKNQLFFEYTEPLRPDWMAIPGAGQAVLFPSTTSRNIPFELDAPRITQGVVEAYTKTLTKVFLRTRADYRDVFGKAHWSEVCFTHLFGDPADQWLACPIAGYIDPDPKTKAKQ
jgi:hypothetical protein